MSGGSELDQLERLNRLREAGALTQEEFEQRKALILNPARPSASRSALPVVAVAVLFLAAIASIAFFGFNGPDKQATTAEPVTPAAPVNPSPEPIPAVPRPTQSATAIALSGEDLLRFATSNEVIGLNPAYLDRRLGVPRESGNGHRVFDVGGCRITYSARSNSVDGFFLDVSPSCQPTIDGRKIGARTTFDSILRSKPGGEYFASCLYMCGNAADPTIDLVYGASRATGFISVSYLAEYGQVADAMTLWEQAIRRQRGLGQHDWPEDSSVFNCVRRPPDNVSRALGRARVTMVFVNFAPDGGDGGC